MLTSDKYQEYIVPHLKNYFDQDCSPEENIPSDLNENHEHPEPQEEPPQKEKETSCKTCNSHRKITV